MQLRSVKWTPVLVTTVVIALVCLMQCFPRLDLFQPLEWKSYDWRVKLATNAVNTATTNLAAVFFDDATIEIFKSGDLGFNYGLYWPREVYRYLLRELSRQGARAVGFDIIFGELRPDLNMTLVGTAGTNTITRRTDFDGDFAKQIRASGNVILAARQEVVPEDLFRTNAWRIGDISTVKDADGVLRRVQPFANYCIYHPLIKEYARVNKLNLLKAQRKPAGLVFPHEKATHTVVEFVLDAGGYFNPREFALKYLSLEDTNQVLKLPVRDKAYTEQRVWHMGILLAAKELGLDLEHAKVDYVQHRIILKGAKGLERIIPLDDEGRIYVDWTITPWDDRLTSESMQTLVAQDILRETGETNQAPARFKDKLVMVGSLATGNDLSDEVVTPLSEKTYGVSQHWNLANSIITDRFIQSSPLSIKLLAIVIMGLTAALLTWELRAIWASILVAVAMLVYVGLAVFLFLRHLYWLPMMLPLVGAALTTHICMVTYRVIFEQQERRRIKSVFSKVVSPNVVNELLGSENISLGGARRQITVYFADVRGFTEMTDVSQIKAEEYVRDNKLAGPMAEQYYETQAREVLSTVNVYLGLIADMVKKHNGTLDKYIGDCVMAFWGAPTLNEQHALCCVRAAIESQRAIYAANVKRQADNQRREQENLARKQNGEPPLPMLPLLALGTGINTGVVTVGLMGSDAHGLNYTVFGREVNLASRLEGVSGRGRIIIGEATYIDLKRDDPALAATCVEHPPVMPKGFHKPVKIYEVPWKPSPAPPAGPAPQAVEAGRVSA